MKSPNPQLDKVYSAESPDETRETYDAWASTYERDVFNYGIRLYANAAAAFAKYVPDLDGPFLDAACGTGLQIESLRLLGYGPFTGVDMSDGMLAVARDKGLYESLEQAVLGEALAFKDDAFTGALCIGALSPTHAPAETFDELIRVTRPGGRIVVTLRMDEGSEPYLETIAKHESAGALRTEYAGKPFATVPLGDPGLRHAVYVFEVT